VSFTVQDLIAERSAPITIRREASVEDALRLMIDGDYSQLPVVNSEGKTEGMITSDCIVRALSHFDLTIKDMRVFHAMTQAIIYRPEDEMLGLLDDLKNTYAIVAVDNNERVIGIVTSYDTTEYFRRRGEDIMVIEDIETMLKEYILVAFRDSAGTVDKGLLATAIDEITESKSKLRAPFGQALHHYLENGNGEPRINQQRANEAFSMYLNPPKEALPFEKLTLNDYIELFLHKSRWERYKIIFDLDSEACRKLLNSVRDIRNELAHFRSEITPHKRELLRFCREWLARHQSEILQSFSKSDENAADKTMVSDGNQVWDGSGAKAFGRFVTDVIKAIRLGKYEGEEIPIQLIEPEDARESRYAPLALCLQGQPLDVDKVEMSFEEIEILIGGRLPRYARQHRSWWANDSTAHVQSIQWLSAGWRASSVSMSAEKVVFSRMKEREQAYIEFYSALLGGLRESVDIPVTTTSPDGQSWINVSRLGTLRGPNTSILSFSFARGARFRVELYIDQGDREANKQIFDNLHQRSDEIESQIGEDLSWERLDQRRASRIAAYRRGSITDEPEALLDLRRWATKTMIKFHSVFRPILLETTSERTSSASN
jgi:CBS domain-containing protein